MVYLLVDLICGAFHGHFLLGMLAYELVTTQCDASVVSNVQG